ncbi:DUF805 domain-containing protein [Luteolibacter pohnpeiensis]|uniref:DUF805 domain-containing protein n=1 Tax=Luteolibacter pohnpeiensis TaxID=454153 RepID=A0A934S3Y8_9BACT|nr:DUF805 domain-containing protein [Luteolibacter pohnpeiensis]MBK1881473.1 DUF805 domain-containing protein [Luteolibacter pohnpeiensis]
MEFPSPYTPPSSLDADSPLSPSRMTVKQILFSFTGRIPRRTFWLWKIVITFGMLISIGLLSPLFEHEGILQLVSGALTCILLFIGVWSGLSISVKRWHDQDKSGWWVLISLIPYLGSLISLIFLGCIAGTPGPNNYGQNPDQLPFMPE